MAVSLTNRQVNKLLEEIVGKESVLVLKACDKKTGVTDEVIAKKTKLSLPKIRSALNNLHVNGLIHYNRVKNAETNWYTYTWFANMDKISEVVSKEWAVYLDKLEKQMDYESNYAFYGCGDACKKLPFELATEYDFKCPDCGKELRSVDNKDRVRELIQEMKEVKTLVKQLG